MPESASAKVSVPPVRVVFEENDRKEILKQIDECLSSGMVAAGKKVREFEEFWANYTRSKHAIACGSGGAALEIIMRALDLKGKDVLVPTNTFIATVNAIIFAGGNPIFLDTDSKSMGVSLGEIKSKLTKNTVGVIVVHIGGIITSEMEDIAQWCRQQRLWLVEDAAHAHGSELNGKRAGQFSLATAYSFFATKVVTCGEGGMVVCNDDGLADLCRSYRDYGKKSQWESVHTVFSSNYRMGETDAIVGLQQVKRLDDFIASRQQVADYYTRHLVETLELVLPPGRNSWYKYIAYLPKGVDRAQFRDKLKERGVSLSGGVYDLPVHLQPVFANWQPKPKLPLSEDLCSRHICLPIFYGMTDAQREHVVASVRSLAESF